jgi:hypothetical protein
MGDKSPKNIHKQEEKRHEKEVEKVHHKHDNAEAQHHPVSGHPEVPAEKELTDDPGSGKAVNP